MKPLRVLVSDTSVLIDLERGGLLTAGFRLPYRLAVPDLLYSRELQDWNGEELIKLGLSVEELDGSCVGSALAPYPFLIALHLRLRRPGPGFCSAATTTFANSRHVKRLNVTACSGFSTRCTRPGQPPNGNYTTV